MELHILERQGCPLHYWTAGPVGRPVVVFTHGVTMDHRIFVRQVEEFARDYRIIAWDVRGHGLSRPMGEGFSIRIAAEDLLAILDAAGCQRAVLVGHSMGGYISQEAAFLRPERVAGLAMIGSTCLTCRQPIFVRLGKRVVPLFFRLVPNRLARWMTGMGAGVKPRTQAAARRASRIVDRRDRARFWAAIMRGYHFEPGYRIKQPLLLTHGVFDTKVAVGVIPPLMRLWARQMPHSHYQVIPEARHNAHQDNPEVFNRLLREFLARIFSDQRLEK